MNRRLPVPFLLACLLAALAPLRSPSVAQLTPGFPGWPAQFEARTLHELPLTEQEQRFATEFPGRIGRFTDGRREIVMRWVTGATRKLHPAADCFRGSGYAVEPTPIETIHGGSWGTFDAQRKGVRMHVREAIVAADGQRWTDASSWYWAAVRDRTQGPWWAITVATSAAPGFTSVPVTVEE
jgi:hypothetical protein